MKGRILLVAAAIVVMILGGVRMPAFAYTGQDLAGGARVSMQRARAIALKAVPGKIVKQELEKETGGSGLRYSFDIRSGATIYEVGVDARTGAVLENRPEGSHPD